MIWKTWFNAHGFRSALAAFGITNTFMSMILMNVRGVKELNILVGSLYVQDLLMLCTLQLNLEKAGL